MRMNRMLYSLENLYNITTQTSFIEDIYFTMFSMYMANKHIYDTMYCKIDITLCLKQVLVSFFSRQTTSSIFIPPCLFIHCIEL